jgi:hypothetical protein
MLNKRTCPQPQGMLRQNVATGRVMKLGQTCTDKRVKAPNVIRESSAAASYVWWPWTTSRTCRCCSFAAAWR